MENRSSRSYRLCNIVLIGFLRECSMDPNDTFVPNPGSNLDKTFIPVLFLEEHGESAKILPRDNRDTEVGRSWWEGPSVIREDNFDDHAECDHDEDSDEEDTGDDENPLNYTWVKRKHQLLPSEKRRRRGSARAEAQVKRPREDDHPVKGPVKDDHPVKGPVKDDHPVKGPGKDNHPVEGLNPIQGLSKNDHPMKGLSKDEHPVKAFSKDVITGGDCYRVDAGDCYGVDGGDCNGVDSNWSPWYDRCLRRLRETQTCKLHPRKLKFPSETKKTKLEPVALATSEPEVRPAMVQLLEEPSVRPAMVELLDGYGRQLRPGPRYTDHLCGLALLGIRTLLRDRGATMEEVKAAAIFPSIAAVLMRRAGDEMKKAGLKTVLACWQKADTSTRGDMAEELGDIVVEGLAAKGGDLGELAKQLIRNIKGNCRKAPDREFK